MPLAQIRPFAWVTSGFVIIIQHFYALIMLILLTMLGDQPLRKQTQLTIPGSPKSIEVVRRHFPTIHVFFLGQFIEI